MFCKLIGIISVAETSVTDVIGQRQVDANSKTIVRKDFPDSRIPSPTRSENMSEKRLRIYNEKHQISRQIARFDLAQEISLQARNIVAAKETRWSGLVKQQLFNNLIQLARSAEGVKRSKAQETVERIQVYVALGLRIDVAEICNRSVGKMKIPGLTVKGF